MGEAGYYYQILYLAKYSFPKVGDIINSESFIYGNQINEREINIVSNAQKSKSTDETRSKSQFIVEFSKMDSGGIARCPSDAVWLDDWKVIARRLNPDGTYDKNAEFIIFFLSHNFIHREDIDYQTINIVGHMELPK